MIRSTFSFQKLATGLRQKTTVASVCAPFTIEIAAPTLTTTEIPGYAIAASIPLEQLTEPPSRKLNARTRVYAERCVAREGENDGASGKNGDQPSNSRTSVLCLHNLPHNGDTLRSMLNAVSRVSGRYTCQGNERDRNVSGSLLQTFQT